MILGKWFQRRQTATESESPPQQHFDRHWNIEQKNSYHRVHSLLKIVYSDAIESEIHNWHSCAWFKINRVEQRNAATISINLSCLNAKHFDFFLKINIISWHHLSFFLIIISFLWHNTQQSQRYTYKLALDCVNRCAHNKTLVNIEF